MALTDSSSEFLRRLGGPTSRQIAMDASATKLADEKRKTEAASIYSQGVNTGIIKEDGKGNFGFNAGTGEYGDMIKMGILDPAKVTRTALQAAGSIAGMMITTEAMVTELPKDEPAAPAMPDMGGMGGMPGMM